MLCQTPPPCLAPGAQHARAQVRGPAGGRQEGAARPRPRRLPALAAGGRAQAEAAGPHGLESEVPQVDLTQGESPSADIRQDCQNTCRGPSLPHIDATQWRNIFVFS